MRGCRWNDQGVALVEVRDWHDKQQRLVRAEHLAASDGYYEYYAGQALSEDRAGYHLRTCRSRDCRLRPPCGVITEIVHLDRWRLRSLGQILKETHTREVGIRLLQEEVSRRKAEGLGSTVAVPPPGEAPLAEAFGAGRGMKDFWARARGQEPDVKERSRSRRRRRRRSNDLGDLVEKKREKRKRSGEDSRSSGSDELLFRNAPSRGGGGRDVQQAAERQPGKLTRGGLEEMGRFLEGRCGASGEGHWRGRKFMAYVSQVLLLTHTPMKIGIQNHREVITVATALDCILAGKVLEAADVLTQRLKALEQSFADGSWATAGHQELIPPSAASISGLEERDLAARAELKAVKLREALEKRKK